MEQINSIPENKITILESIMSNIIENIPYLVLFWKAFIVKSKIKYFIFSIINIIINTVLKNIIREKRPTPTMKYGEYQKYGMPSGHAQFLWFSLFYDFNWDIQHLIILMLCVISSIQRIVIKLHTSKQVLIGSIIGTILGFYFQKL